MEMLQEWKCCKNGNAAALEKAYPKASKSDLGIPNGTMSEVKRRSNPSNTEVRKEFRRTPIGEQGYCCRAGVGKIKTALSIHPRDLKCRSAQEKLFIDEASRLEERRRRQTPYDKPIKFPAILKFRQLKHRQLIVQYVSRRSPAGKHIIDG